MLSAAPCVRNPQRGRLGGSLQPNCSNIGCAEGFGEQKSLAFEAALRLQKAQLAGPLDAFGDHAQVQFVR